MATNPFDEFQPATPANPFDEFEQVGPTTRQVLHTAVRTNPDDAAEVARLAKRYPGPNDVLLRSLKDVKLQEAVDKADESLKTSVKLSEYMRTSPFAAQQAHDDLGTLAQLERFATDTYGSVEAGVFNASKGAAGVFRAASELAAPVLDFLEAETPEEFAGWRGAIGGNPLRRLAEGFALQGAGAGAQAKAAAPKTEGVLEGGFQSGIQSLTQNLLALPMAFLPGGQPAALTMMTASTGGQAYQDAREKGLSMSQALPFAASQAAIEYATEKLPLAQLLGDVRAGTSFIKTLAKQVALEVPGEQVATILQDMNEWAVLNPEKPFSSYLAERPSAAAQTLVATIVGAGGNVAVAKGIETAVNAVSGTAARMSYAENEARKLQDALAVAAQSKLRERNPDTFRDLAANLTDDATVFVDAQVLAQSATELAQALPAVAEQLEAAVATNSTIEIPVADILTLAPGTPLEQVFLQNARQSPDAMSLADVTQAGEQAQQFLQQEAERVMQQAQDQQAWQASSEAVKQTILGQLNQAGRFSADVNEAYAALQMNFFSTMAARLGTTPQELYDRYSLKVAQQTPGQGNVLNAGLKTGEVEVEAFHYSKADRTYINTTSFGSGLQGSGRDTYMNAADKRLRNRAYFYFDKGTGINPEAGVGGRGHKTTLRNIYDSNADPLRLKQGRGQLEFESAVLDAGFSGYLDNLEGTQSGQVILLGPQSVPVENLGELGTTRGTVPRRATRGEGKGRDKFVDQLNEHKFAIAGEAGLGTWSTLIKRALPEAHAAMEAAGVFQGEGRFYKDGLIKRFMSMTEAQVYEQSLSSRLPGGRKATEDPLADTLGISWDVALSDETTLAKNVAAMQAYPNFPKLTGKGAKSTSRNAEAIITHMVDNLLWLHDHMPAPMRERARLWYDGGRKTVEAWADRYGITEMQGAAAIAVLSPQNGWFANVSQAERIADMVFGLRDFAWDDAMTAEALRISKDDGLDDKMQAAQGKTLGELLATPELAARWIRVYDQTYNNRAYRVLTPEGGAADYVKTGKGNDATMMWKSYSTIAKAVSVLMDGRAENVHYQIGKEHKVRNFYNNIFAPKSEIGYATIDTHAVAAALLRPLASADLEVDQAFGSTGSASSLATGLNGTYPIYWEAYRRAAEARGLQPREMQSITWEAVRGLFEAAQKKSMKADANAIWERFRKGELTQHEAQREILALAGDITPPSWTEVPFNDTPSRTYEGPAQRAIDERGPVGKAETPTARVMFEVAPDPNDEALTAEWNALSSEERLALSQQVAADIVPKVLKELGTGGDFVMQVGGYMGATNPSMTLRVERPELALTAAKLLGYTLSQDSMMVVTETQVVGTDEVGAVTVKLPDGFSEADIAALYTRIYELEHGGEKLAGGHTTADGQMVILNYSPLSTEEMAEMIFNHLGGEFDVDTNVVYSAFPAKDNYGYGQTDTPSEGDTAARKSPAQRRPDSLRAEATQLLRAALDARGAQRGDTGVLEQAAQEVTPGTDAFDRWFGQSQAVDAQGNPQLYYHGTSGVFEAFTPRQAGAIFLTPNPAFASGFAESAGREGANVVPLYVSVQNAFDYENPEHRAALQAWLEQKHGVDGQITIEAPRVPPMKMPPAKLAERIAKGQWMFVESPAVQEYVRAVGHDGFWSNERGTKNLAVFDASQVKSPFNRGTFNPASPDYLEQGPRGAFNPQTLLLTLNENADLSTFLHESGHFFLEVMADLASQPDAPQQIVDDMAATLKWFGIKGDEQVGGADSGSPLAQQDAEAVSEAIYKEMAADDGLVAALEAWMVDGAQPDAATNEKLLGYMRRMPPVPRDSYLTFYRGQPRGVTPHSRGWASWTTNSDTTRFFTEGNSEVLKRKGVQGVSLEQVALWRTRATGELTDYGSQGEWLVLNESVFAQDGNLPVDNTQPIRRTPLETWRAMTLDQKRPYHEKWAESFEQYLFEGKAPSTELQPLFRRFRSWMINVYKSLTAFMRGRDLKLGDDIRQVFDRLIATDEQIAQAEQAAGLMPEFDATNEAIEKLQARSLRDLKWTVGARNKAIKALQKQAAELRKGVEAEVRAEVEAQPVYAARKFLRTDTKLAIAGLEDLYMGEGDRYALLDWKPLVEQKLAGKEGLHPDLVADMFGFASGDQLVRAILDAQPINDVIQGMTDQRMLERHGDLVDQRAIEEAANEAVHNEARARRLATELKAQADMMNPRQDTGRTDTRGRPITVNAISAAAKEFAANLAARRRIKDLKNAAWQHRSAEARAGKAWQDATAKGDTQAAVQAKRDQVLNNAAAKALQDAQAETRKILEFFKRVAKGNDEKVVKGGRDPDVVNAMRAILGAYDIAPRLEKAALEYMETVSRNDPAMYAALQPSVQGAINNAKPLPEMTMEELRGLNDELRAMWALAKRSRQMEIDGNLLDRQDLADELLARMNDIGIPAEIPGERAAITDREEAGIKLQFAKSILSRVEQWAERMDGKFGGPFLRFVFQPIKEAADAYRTARVDYRKRFTALVENVAPAIRPGAIPASELGYTFGNSRDSGQAELLHAILHTGNDSNKRKLLLGRGWATENPDGTLDTSRWDAFIQRMQDTGVLRKEHYDFAQGVWDLLEEMKPLAQETHRNVFGRYFAEVTANAFETPFGSYRGGYVPAQTDALLVRDAKLRELAEGENETMAYAFPSAPSGFTKARVEYNKPLLLDLRALAQHIDKVLLFSYMQGPVTDVRRLLTDKGVAYALDRIDPGAYEGMLIPWLNRSARQIVETPVAGDRKLSRFLSAARSRAGMALMFANLSNTFQQITGFSMAAVKVRPSLMLKATAEFTRSPKAMKERVAAASEFMRNRMLNEIGAMNDAVEQILVDATKLEKAQAWTREHAYFLQAAVDNTMSPIIWTAAYNQGVEQQMNHKDAVRFADGVIRQTQGTTLPEDISRFESGSAIARTFTQFVGYFNMMANTNATAAKQVIDEVGLRKGAGRLLGIALAGLLVPIWVAEAIAQAFRGGPDDEDDDGYLDDWLMAVFGLGTLRGMVAQVPIVGQMAQLAVNRFNDNPADDKFSLSPAVSLIESAVSSPASVYKAIVDEGSAQKAVRDVAAAATLITGLPIYGAARPIGYLAGVADERIEPTGPIDFTRGLVTGTASPESKQP